MKLIGDPHLGRVFKAHVPLDRRGEREQNMLKQFEEELKDDKETLIVVVGDLFEHWFVSHETIYQTLRILNAWQPAIPFQRIVIMQGNHDYSPEEGVYGAFDILEEAMKHNPHIVVVRAPQTLFGTSFFPWQWNKTAEEQVNELKTIGTTVVGHWDLESFNSDTTHLCPVVSLVARGVKEIYSGHWHVAGIYDINGVDVICTGSMQPMTHAEDPEGKLYVTLTVDEYNRTDLNDLRDKYVRVLVSDKEIVAPPQTCLGFKIQRSVSSETSTERVILDTFDLDAILDKSFEKHAVPDPIREELKGRLSNAIT